MSFKHLSLSAEHEHAQTEHEHACDVHTAALMQRRSRARPEDAAYGLVDWKLGVCGKKAAHFSP